jgi:catechol 2,3-dioxygenase-like lactoylglutathione lyase family enzyme
MTSADVPPLAGVHHVKLPVADLERSRDWYERVLGFAVTREFVEDGRLMGVFMDHPTGIPPVALRRDPERASGAAGFDYFGFAVRGKQALEAIAAHLDALGESHSGIQPAGNGWMLAHLHDPDGFDLRFYTFDV